MVLGGGNGTRPKTHILKNDAWKILKVFLQGGPLLFINGATPVINGFTIFLTGVRTPINGVITLLLSSRAHLVGDIVFFRGSDRNYK